MKPIQTRYWKHGVAQDTKQLTNTSLLTRDFLIELVGKSPDDEESKSIAVKFNEFLQKTKDLKEVELLKIFGTKKKNTQSLDCTLEDEKAEDKLEIKYGGVRKRVEIRMIEFSWIFTKKECLFFLD